VTHLTRVAAEESGYFLKKRTKKFLSVAFNIGPTRPASSPDTIRKSFVLLFFKKERSSFFLDGRH